MKRVSKMFKKKSKKEKDGARSDPAQEDAPISEAIEEAAEEVDEIAPPPPPSPQEIETIRPPSPVKTPPPVATRNAVAPKVKGPPMVECPEGGAADFLTPAQVYLMLKLFYNTGIYHSKLFSHTLFYFMIARVNQRHAINDTKVVSWFCSSFY